MRHLTITLLQDWKQALRAAGAKAVHGAANGKHQKPASTACACSTCPATHRSTTANSTG